MTNPVSDEIADKLEENLESLLENTQQDLNDLHSQLLSTDSVKSECQCSHENQVIANKRLEDLRIQVNIKILTRVKVLFDNI